MTHILATPAQDPTDQPTIEFRYDNEDHQFASADEAYQWLLEEEESLNAWIEQERRELEERQRNLQYVQGQRRRVTALRQEVAPHL